MNAVKLSSLSQVKTDDDDSGSSQDSTLRNTDTEL